jgi:hypothetical protein
MENRSNLLTKEGLPRRFSDWLRIEILTLIIWEADANNLGVNR